MKVLSLFGGIEAGRVALDILGINPESYHSAEFDPYPMKVSAANYPDITHIGSVTEVNGHDFEGIDLLIGGPPCQDLSIAGKRAGLEGSRSSLFWEYVRILNEAKPKFFLVENVASMSKEAKAQITEALFGIEPVLINSALVSAQNRKRLFWVGRRNEDGTYSKVEVPQPEDRGIVLKDILEPIPLTDGRWKPLDTKYIEAVSKRIAGWSENQKRLIAYQSDIKRSTAAEHVYTKEEGKTDSCTVAHVPKMVIGTQDKFAITATYANVCPQNHIKCDRTVILGQYQLPHGTNPGGLRDAGKAQALTTSQYVYNNQVVGQMEPYCLNPKVEGKQPSLADRIYSEEAKAPAVTTCFITNVTGLAHRNRGEGKEPECNGTEKANSITSVQSDSEVLAVSQEPKFYWRKLTIRECARLQTFPDTFSFEAVSNSRAYKGIGNSWTVEVIAHIFRSIFNNYV